MQSVTSPRSLAAWRIAATILVLPVAAAQSDDVCESEYGEEGEFRLHRAGDYHVNMTDTAAVESPKEDGQDWLMTVTVRDYRGESSPHEYAGQTMSIYMDLPEDVYGSADTSFCYGRLGDAGGNATARQSRNNGCGRVLSERCIAALEAMRSPGDSSECPLFGLLGMDECSDYPMSNGIFTFNFATLSASNCTLDEIPGRGPTPDGYQTIGIASGLLATGYDLEREDNFTRYDQLAKATWPFVVYTRHRDADGNVVQGAQVVCLSGGLAGGNFTEGSRVPGGSGGNESDGDESDGDESDGDESDGDESDGDEDEEGDEADGDEEDESDEGDSEANIKQAAFGIAILTTIAVGTVHAFT